MARVNKTISLTGTTGVMVDLREEGATGTDYNKVGYLEFEFWSKVDSITAVVAVTPIVVADGDAPPTASVFPAFSGHGDAADALVMQVDADEATFVRTRATAKLGVPYSKGFSKDVYPNPLATHLNVVLQNASNECYLRIIGE